MSADNAAAWREHFTAERAEDVQWMLETGASLTDAARRLGITAEGLERWCQRHAMSHEAQILKSRDPLNEVKVRAARTRWDRQRQEAS